MNIDVLVFLLALTPIPFLVFLAKKRSTSSDEFGGKTYGKIMVGISAAATGNSGFIMTGAVGLGYGYGMQWILLPLSWLLGDLIFWRYGPKSINAYCRSHQCVNIGQIISGNNKKYSITLYVLTSLFITVFLGAYISAQWVAGSKVISGFLNIESTFSIIGIGTFVTGYCLIGKFRGSVYTDLYQGILMILVTIASLILAFSYEATKPSQLPHNFNLLFGNMTITTLIGFVFGYAVASVGFGFGQPQITSRYIAGKNPEEVASAKWIYILFLQFTWIGMTYFGILLRTKGFIVDDPEALVVPFFQSEAGEIFTGIAVAGIFAAIASTVDSIMISITSLFKNGYRNVIGLSSRTEGFIVIAIGLFTVLGALNTKNSVFEIALMSISMVGATLAGPVIIRLFNFKHNDFSVLISLLAGGFSGYLWRSSEYGVLTNEALIGIFFALIINYIIALFAHIPTEIEEH